MMESATGQNLHALQGDRILQNIQMYKPFVDEEGRKQLQEGLKAKLKNKKNLPTVNGESQPQTARNDSVHTRLNSINQMSAKSLSMTPAHSRLDHNKQSTSILSKHLNTNEQIQITQHPKASQGQRNQQRFHSLQAVKKYERDLYAHKFTMKPEAF